MTGGRKPGLPTGPTPGSLNDRLSRIAVGETVYMQTTLDDYITLQRRITAASRYPSSMQGRKFSCSLFTAVSAASAADIRYLVAVERIA